jgi:hypothetical protein
MGMGDFLSDIGDAIVPEAVEDWAGGISHGAQAVAGMAGNVAQAGMWAANPTHWDDIGRGVGAAANFVADNPGQTWDIAFEVGRHIVKEELLDPKNLAINLALTGATLATGGAAGAAWLAKAGKTGMTAIRSTRVGARVLRGAKEAEGAVAGARALSTGAKWADRTGDVIGDARDARRMVDRIDSFISPNARLEGLKAQFSPGYRARGAIANRIEGQAPGIGRQMFADYVRQSATKPVFTEGASKAAQTIGTNVWRAKRVGVKVRQGQLIGAAGGAGEEVFQATTNPLGYAIGKARAHGYDPVSLAQKALKGGATKAGMKALDASSQGRQRRDEPMAMQPGPDYSIATSAGGESTPYRTGRGAGPRVSEYQTESADVGPITVGRRRSAFYEGTTMAYGTQSEYEYA